MRGFSTDWLPRWSASVKNPVGLLDVDQVVSHRQLFDIDVVKISLAC